MAKLCLACIDHDRLRDKVTRRYHLVISGCLCHKLDNYEIASYDSHWNYLELIFSYSCILNLPHVSTVVSHWIIRQ